MSSIRSFSVGNGDMFYIRHNSDNFSIIDCCLSPVNEKDIVDEIVSASDDKGVVRFVSTHPDEDHIRGLSYLDERLGIRNFYCVKNAATKEDESDDFIRYCDLRDSSKAFYLYRDCTRRWMNEESPERDSSGLNVIWPVRSNPYFQAALKVAEDGGSPNNISVVMRYSRKNGVKAMWMGDLETEFMENVAHAIAWPRTDIVFAPHHGRYSGKIPDSLLDQIKPKIVVLGEAPSRHLHYYGGYHTITQNSAGDIWMDCLKGVVRIFVSNPDYDVDFLDTEDDYETLGGHYLGSLFVNG